MKRLTFEFGPDLDRDKEADVVAGQFSIPLPNKQAEEWANGIVGLVDSMDCQPDDGEMDFSQVIKFKLWGPFKVSVGTKVTARVEDMPAPAAEGDAVAGE